MKKNKLRTFLIVWAVMFLSMLSAAPSLAQMNKPPEREAAEAIDAFGFNLLRFLQKSQPDQNIVISPLSISLALGMTYNGADGDTAEAMRRVLVLPGDKPEQANIGYAKLMAVLAEADPEVALQIANSIWVNNRIELAAGFSERVRASFVARIDRLDFTDPQAVRTINAWVAEQTKDKIKTILDRLTGDDLVVLVNAVYFKGKWSLPFDPQRTQEKNFNLMDGGAKKASFMIRRDTFPYYEEPGFAAVRLPYGNRQFSMVVLLPDKAETIESFGEKLNFQDWWAWQRRFTRRPGTVELPRFTNEYSVGLKEALTTLGMGVAFSGGADFSRMVSGPAFISLVVHKTFIEVNEEGTEAAAATAVVVTKSAMVEPQEPFHLVVDRPFFFAIVHERTNAVLFMGVIVDSVE